MTLATELTDSTGHSFESVGERTAHLSWGPAWMDSRGVNQLAEHGRLVAVSEYADGYTVEFHDHNSGDMKRLKRLTYDALVAEVTRRVKT